MINRKILLLGFLAVFSGLTNSETTGFSVGLSTLREVQDIAAIELLAVNSSERVSIYGMDIRTVEKQECMSGASLISLTLIFSEQEILINEESIYKGNVLPIVQKCLDKSFVIVNMTPEEVEFFGAHAAKYSNDDKEAYMFYTSLEEDTTRVLIKPVSDVN